MTEEWIEPLDERVRLVELVDRVLDKGVVLRGDVTISVAGIDLIYLELRLLLSGVESLERRKRDAASLDAGRAAAAPLPPAPDPPPTARRPDEPPPAGPGR